MSLLSTRFVLGTASLGSKLGFQNSKALVQCAYGMGFRSFDTAVIYGSYQAHDVLQASLHSVNDAVIYSKFLSSNYTIGRDLVKLLVCRCGYRSYLNFVDVIRLHKQSERGSVSLADLERWIGQQTSRYDRIRISSWLAHSPSPRLLSALKESNVFSHYGLSASLNDASAGIETDVLQTDAASFWHFDPQSIRAKKILLHQVVSFSRQIGIEMPALVRRLLVSDPRVSIVVGTTKISRLEEIEKLAQGLEEELLD